MKKVLVTGANGFVAHYLIQQLLERNYLVIATGIGNNRLAFQHGNLIYAEMDITDVVAVASVFNEHHPDVVVHTAAVSKPDECEQNKEQAYRINVEGTKHLLAASVNSRCFFIFLSTDFVFDGEKGFYKEDDERGAVNYYGETKIIAEDEVKKYPYAWCIVRTILVYGPVFSGRENIVTSVAKSLQRGVLLTIYNDQVRMPTYVEDLAGAIISIIEMNATGIFHISGKDVRTPYEIAMEVASCLQLDQKLVTPVTRESFVQPALRPLKTGFDLTRASKLLDYDPLPFREGLRKTLEQL